MFERPQSGEKVVLVHIDFNDDFSQEHLAEFRELAAGAGAKEQALITGMKSAPEPRYFVGSGKAEEIRAAVVLYQADLVLFNHELSPSQERNLECLVKCRVCDRTGLILDIFAQRARTFEGKLQVELAQLQHLSTRLIRGWTHLERQKGGIGLRGPGETQLETDRRLLRGRIKTIHKRLEKVRKQRNQNRQARRKAAMPAISIVGYTNAGKSSLFNRITEAEIYAADQLFATLDPTLRRIDLPGAGSAIVADTVGFIRDLPHDLIEAFRATLEETRDANLLLHIVDLSNPNHREQMQEVDAVLNEIGAQDVPVLLVYNKIDNCQDVDAKLEYDIDGKPHKIWLSAATGEGCERLHQAISEHLYGDPVYRSLCLSPEQGKLRATLYAMQAVLNERVDEQGNWLISIRMTRKDYQHLFEKNT